MRKIDDVRQTQTTFCSSRDNENRFFSFFLFQMDRLSKKKTYLKDVNNKKIPDFMKSDGSYVCFYVEHVCYVNERQNLHKSRGVVNHK